MGSLYLPTRVEAEKDREKRNKIRNEVRFDAMTYGTDLEKRAAQMAMKGYGVEAIVARTGISRVQANALVLGEFST